MESSVSGVRVLGLQGLGFGVFSCLEFSDSGLQGFRLGALVFRVQGGVLLSKFGSRAVCAYSFRGLRHV